jgi:hypothetical protein
MAALNEEQHGDYHQRVNMEDHSHILGQLITAGFDWTERLARADNGLAYSNWAAGVRGEFRETSIELSDSQLHWAWNAIREEETVRSRFGALPPPGVQWKSSRDRFLVLSSGEIFAVALKAAELDTLLRNQAKDSPWRVTVRLVGQLEMKPGKADRLECCDVRADVRIQVSTCYPVEREADVMRIDADRISVEEGVVTARVDSLNQAYTVASRRLEPERRSHGGRTYDRYVLMRSNERLLLERIRQRVEAGDWPEPARSERT